MVMEALVYFQVFLAGWVSCHFYMVWKLRQALKKVAEDNGMTLDEMAESFLATRGIQTVSVPNYFTETNGSSILLYNKDTGTFVGQAVSLEELAQNVYQFDKVVFALVKHNDQQYWFVEGKVENNLTKAE
jgi:hypothetical protein